MRAIALLLMLACSACAGVPPPPPPVVQKPAGPTFETKMSWVLRLEDERLLRDPAAAPPAPDLIGLLSDPEARIRRRAALAAGRVGLRDGVEPLIPLLSDADPEVRQMAAFALGLLGDPRARDPLVEALGDASPLVQGSAAQALGLVGDSAAIDPIGAMVARIVQSGAVALPPAAEDEARRDTPAAAFRLGVFALVQLKAYERLASAVLDPGGQPRVLWWPVAYALERLGDRRALGALITLAKDAHPDTRAFAVKGLGALNDPAALAVLVPLLESGDRPIVIEAIRALARMGGPPAARPLMKILETRGIDPQIRLEAVAALAGTHAPDAPGVMDALLDLVGDPNPSLRAAALKSTAALDPEEFITVLSGLESDEDWRVREALADALGTLPPEVGTPRLMMMLGDTDQRVIPSVLRALIRVRAPGVASILVDRLKADDPAVRAAAAKGVGELTLPNGVPALTRAYQLGLSDTMYIARAAALEAITHYSAADAVPLLQSGLADKDWAVRVRAAALLRPLDRSIDVDTLIRPAPARLAADSYQSPRLLDPPVSTQVYIDTDRGTIQIELAVLEAPLTVDNFAALARKGFFNGLSIHRVVPNFMVQDGDPRGDGEGGPGYTIRDELNELPYLRGTVGMALDWSDTGGSQFFIAEAPQPQLDARYTAFGRVVTGIEVVDRIQPGDVIRAVRVWDGSEPGPDRQR